LNRQASRSIYRQIRSSAGARYCESIFTIDRTMSNRIPSLPADLSKMAILLDVDGTLLDLAPTPREVFVSHELRDTLGRLSKRTGGAVAFVSGRPVSELDLIFSPLQLPAIGGHGAEFRAAAGAPTEAARLPPLDAVVKRQFAAIAEAGPGIILEDKGYSLALHYRLAPDKEHVVRDAAMKIWRDLNTTALEILPGKLVLEVKQVGTTKATAVRELMRIAPFAGRRPVFIGDDITDLGVFAILPELGGIGVSVGRNVPGVDACFERPTDVRHWLQELSHSDAFATP
jgi:trehalose 6-phosphate phosphatase